MTTLSFTSSHEWLLQDNEIATVGITDHAQGQLGDVVYIGLPEVGDEFQSGEEMVVIESVKAAGGIQAPCACAVVEVNEALNDTPELVNEDPMGEGWILKIRPSEEISTALKLTQEQYEASLED